MRSHFPTCMKEETVYYGKYFLDTYFSSLEIIKIQNSSVKQSLSKNIVSIRHKNLN